MVNFEKKDRYDFAGLVRLVAFLRGENGCDWDRVQTHESIRRNFLEEAYEACDGMDLDDPDVMKEEFGDVLLQVVFHSGIEADRGRFTIDDVCTRVCEKMIRRHPHVFGDAKVDDSKGVVRQWERIKAQEKNNLKMQGKSAMDKVSKSLPTLARAQELQRRAAKVSFDWTEAEPVFNKAVEEFSEFRAEMQAASPENRNIERMEDEFGDIMFSLVNVARHCGFNAALALERANSKFERRFRVVEQMARDQGKEMKDVGLEGLQEMWKQAKAASKSF